MMVSVGIDVSKDKHDCFIVNSEGEILADVFTIPNNMDGFHYLLQRIQDCANTQNKIKVVLEATGHSPKAATSGIWLLRSGMPPETLLAPGCPPSPLNYSTPSGSSVLNCKNASSRLTQSAI